MSTIRFETSPKASPVQGSPLDDYYPSLLIDMDVPPNLGGYHGDDPTTQEGDPDDLDLYAQLAQKDQDLILAAEIGKSLLEKNEELTKANEKLTEEYSQKYEQLKQENHELRMRSETLESEYEMTIKELQNDVTTLRQEMDAQQTQQLQGDRSRGQIVHELTQQNERLTEQLKKVTQNEEQLQSQIYNLRSQVQNRRMSTTEHIHQLEVLREEIEVIDSRKVDLERRIHQLSEERDSLGVSLEEAQDRILMLEKTKREQEAQLRNLDREISEVREQNLHLEEKLESLTLQNSSSVFNHSANSLFSELSMSQHMSTDSLDTSHQPSNDDVSFRDVTPLRDVSDTSFRDVTRPHTLYVPGGTTLNFLSDDDDDIECDDVVVTTSCGRYVTSSPVSMATQYSSSSPVSMTTTASPAISSPPRRKLIVPDNQLIQQFHPPGNGAMEKFELEEVYRQLKQMVSELQGQRHDRPRVTVSSWEDEVEDDEGEDLHDTPQPGSLLEVLRVLRNLVENLSKRQQSEAGSPVSTSTECLDLEGVGQHEGRVQEVRQELHEVQEELQEVQEELDNSRIELDKLKQNVTSKDEEIKRKNTELAEMGDKLKLTIHEMSQQHERLVKLQSERDKLQDQAAGLTRDDIVDQARKDRDEALEKKNSMEIELAKARLDLMNLDSQLMEAIQQKIQLSQQLEQWQMDMENLLEFQVHERLKTEDRVEKTKTELEQEKKQARSPFPWS